MGYRWPGFRRVRGQVCKRISRRLRELRLADLNAYRSLLEDDEAEWRLLDTYCRITISRFYRDRAVFDTLRFKLLPLVGRRTADAGRPAVDCWSAGCCSGEEPYTLQILWELSVKPASGVWLPLHVVATDTDPHLLERAQNGIYPSSVLKDLPDGLAAVAFDEHESEHTLKSAFRANINWLNQDVRHATPEGPFDLVLCRNLAFTYFDKPTQSEVLRRINASTRDGGFLIIGSHERLPAEGSGWYNEYAPCVFEKLSSP